MVGRLSGEHQLVRQPPYVGTPFGWGCKQGRTLGLIMTSGISWQPHDSFLLSSGVGSFCIFGCSFPIAEKCSAPVYQQTDNRTGPTHGPTMMQHDTNGPSLGTCTTVSDKLLLVFTLAKREKGFGSKNLHLLYGSL